MFSVATLLVGAMILTEVTSSFKPWTRDMIIGMEGCMEADMICMTSCKDETDVDYCVREKCIAGSLACREFTIMILNSEEGEDEMTDSEAW